MAPKPNPFSSLKSLPPVTAQNKKKQASTRRNLHPKQEPSTTEPRRTTRERNQPTRYGFYPDPKPKRKRPKKPNPKSPGWVGCIVDQIYDSPTPAPKFVHSGATRMKTCGGDELYADALETKEIERGEDCVLIEVGSVGLS